MLALLKPFFKYYILWVVFFILARLCFLIYHAENTQQLDFQEIINTFRYGLLLDLSAAGYFSVIPFFLLVIGATIGSNTLTVKLLKFYTYTVLAICSFLITADFELYANWRFRLDDIALNTLKDPAETAASAGASPVFSLVSFVVILATIFIYIFNRVVFKPLVAPTLKTLSSFSTDHEPLPLKNRLFSGFIGIILMFALIIPIRGGFQLAPINQSAVYFSQKTFANHAALNAIWNFMISVYEDTANTDNPFKYFETAKAQGLVTKLFQKDTTGTQYLIKKDIKNPNIIIITWESFTAKVVERLGGDKGVTPQFDALCKEGILFNNIYSTGHRTHFGLMGVLGGYPCISEYNIFEIPRKAAQLPCMGKSLKQMGYETGFYYGGEAEFANFKNYLVTGQFTRLVTKSEFAKKDQNSKWGAFDHTVLERANKDLKVYKQPFFVNILTLSSHEPFELPEGDWALPNFDAKTADVDGHFKNAMHYTDKAFGQFIEEAKKQDWWKNTLIVVIADHGSPHVVPHDNELTNFHVPMLWLGGALAVKDTVIPRLGCQTDIAATVLAQVDIKADEYIWSKNVMSKHYKPFAYFNFHNGFGFLQEKGGYVWDTEGKYIRRQIGVVDSSDIELGKAYIQSTYQDYLNK
jgi:phosphoglycerol transferase MdoB-like AlkP superfamily enzyme